MDDEFKTNPKVQVHDFADDLSLFYDAADFVISPIFLGSGMKTKTGEALMHGKAVLGTTEAFEGYDIDCSKAGARCDTAEEFIRAIKHFQLRSTNHTYNRTAFIEKYSTAAEKAFARSLKESLGPV